MKTVRVIFKVLKGVAKLVVFLAENDVIKLPTEKPKRQRKPKTEEPKPAEV